jgi:hypothetical protein
MKMQEESHQKAMLVTPSNVVACRSIFARKESLCQRMNLLSYTLVELSSIVASPKW